MLYQENLIYSDFASLAQSTAIILTRLKVRKNIAYFLEGLCANSSKLDEKEHGVEWHNSNINMLSIVRRHFEL